MPPKCPSAALPAKSRNNHVQSQQQQQQQQQITFPAGIYLLKISEGKTGAMCEICSKLIIKTPEQPGVFTLNIFHTFLLCSDFKQVNI